MSIFFIITPHMTPFWNPWDHGSTQKVFPGFMVTIGVEICTDCQLSPIKEFIVGNRSTGIK